MFLHPLHMETNIWRNAPDMLAPMPNVAFSLLYSIPLAIKNNTLLFLLPIPDLLVPSAVKIDVKYLLNLSAFICSAY